MARGEDKNGGLWTSSVQLNSPILLRKSPLPERQLRWLPRVFTNTLPIKCELEKET